MEKKKQIRAIAKNVTHYYTDPVTGERKSIYIGDGPIDEINKKIIDFMRSLHDNAENQTESDTEQ